MSSSTPSKPSSPSYLGAATPFTRLNPFELTARITHSFRSKLYFSITNAHHPLAPWHPLMVNPELETRPCHYTDSRVHILTCGHTIAVKGDAESCAANCALTTLWPSPSPNEGTSFVSSNTPPARYQDTLNKIRQSIELGVNSYIASLKASSSPSEGTAIEQGALVHIQALKHIWKGQEARLRPVPDLLSGDFKCVRCGTPGQREETWPALVYHRHDTKCVVVGREPIDVKVIEELEMGARPVETGTETSGYDRGSGSGGGRGGHHGGSSRGVFKETLDEKKVRGARITKARVQEKKKVLEKIRTDVLNEEWGALNLEN